MNKRLLNILIPANRSDKKRLLIDVLIAALVFCGYFWYTHWTPAHKLESEHYIAFSNASIEDTQDALSKAETLWQAYTAFWDVKAGSTDKKLLLKIYSSRKEFKRANPLSGWAEAFYTEPYCHQYIEAESENKSHHWMVHEATHQLNNEVSQFNLPQWAEEGIACYFSTTRMADGKMTLGVIDRNTYPIWWLSSLGLSGDLSRDKADKKIVSIKSIVNDEKPLVMNKHVNLYYIHWFSLVHFLLEGEQGKYREAFIACVKTPSGLEAFERNIGPYQLIEPQWYRHLFQITKGKKGTFYFSCLHRIGA
ncbi:MAG: hypothetical protein CEE38_13340 [Planctomycetes bacterium B3_Pla]|nr:MAG: hypothetical protein CEE38_13340 [Planctomycetes bacterium B3_Pla]